MKPAKSAQTGTSSRPEAGERRRAGSPGSANKLNADVLIVEDSHMQALQLRHVLEQEGCCVRVAGDGVHALEMLLAKRPHVVISDIVMPEMDGYELCRRIKRDPNLAEIPVILVTTLSDPQDVLKGLECGADNMIPKPYDKAYLVSRVRYSLDNCGRCEEEGGLGGVMIAFAGHEYYITARRLQIINLLLSTYETAVQKNSDLERVNRELLAAQATLAKQAEELRELSLRDGLTGLYNRRGFDMLADHELKVAARTHAPALILYLDIDGMKDINDAFGHGEGDSAIVALADALLATVREIDVVARVGGDEFVVLQIGASTGDAETFSERLMKHLAGDDRGAKCGYEVVPSIGVAAFDPEKPRSLEALVKKADTAMYAAKKAKHKGRARG